MSTKRAVIIYSRQHVNENELRRVVNIIESKGIQIITKIDSESINKVPDNVDIAIVLGGDGTLLNVAKRIKVPCFGIRYGKVGALSEISPREINKAIQLYTEHKYDVIEYTLLKCTVSEMQMTFHFFNDLVVISPERSLIYFDLVVDDEYLCSVRADGVIISTTIGSTAYALSAGGPIVDEEVNGVIIVAVCPQLGIVPPLVFSQSRKIKIKFRAVNKLLLVIDGSEKVELPAPFTLIITKSSKTVGLIRFKRFFRLKRILNLMLAGSGVHKV